MMKTNDKSRYLSSVLRHDPGKIGLTLDAQGWVDVADLLAAVPFPLSKDELAMIVRTNDKQRFALSDDATRIRANQGHSVTVDLALPEAIPPGILFHGTSAQAAPIILVEGLTPQKRHHVHLSADQETAIKVGSRHGAPVVLSIDCKAMMQDGCKFYLAENGVWLTDKVAPNYLTLLAGKA